MTRAGETIVAEVQLHASARGTPLLVGLDGRSGTGKSTLAASVALAVGGAAINVDDFSTGENERDARPVEIVVDGALDWQRLRREALEPLLAGTTASWHPFDFVARSELSPRVNTCSPAPVIILDGLYSTRPELTDLLGLRILVEAPENLRARRLAAREGDDFMRVWQPIWNAREDYYFSIVRPRAAFDLVVESDEA